MLLTKTSNQVEILNIGTEFATQPTTASIWVRSHPSDHLTSLTSKGYQSVQIRLYRLE